MPQKPWKQFEIRLRDALGGERTPLSGEASRHTKADLIHDTLFVEAKRRKNVPLYDELQGMVRRAGNYDRVPLIVCDYIDGGTVAVRWYTLFMDDWLLYYELDSLGPLPEWHLDDLFDEFLVKHKPGRRVRFSGTVQETMQNAAVEDKRPLVCVQEHNRNKVLVLIPEDREH